MSAIVVDAIFSIGSAALTASGILFLAKTWMSERIKNSIKNEYDQKLETHKAELKAKSDVEIEKLRSQLHVTATEHTIKYSRLYEKRAEIIAETYSTLKALLDALNEYVKPFETSGDPPREDRYKTLVEAHKSFYRAYSSKLIFFPKSVADKLNTINKECVKAGNSFRYFVDVKDKQGDIKKWIEISDTVENKINEALLELENEFRKILEGDNPTVASYSS